MAKGGGGQNGAWCVVQPSMGKRKWINASDLLAAKENCSGFIIGVIVSEALSFQMEEGRELREQVQIYYILSWDIKGMYGIISGDVTLNILLEGSFWWLVH